MYRKLALAFFLCSGMLCAQWQLTPYGLTHKDQDYLVLTTDQDAQTLYQITLDYLHGLYTHPDRAISVIPGERITVNAQAPNSIHRNGLHVFNMEYTLAFRFKDGKVRVDAPSFILTTYTDKLQQLHIVWEKMSLDGSNLGIYGKKGKLKSKRAKTDLEQYFNNYILAFKNHLNNPQDNNW
ncbi:hypothetical protein [Croceivirga sp. JEA036]|uniref:hypothetical protein n=1 Tax=Croceivirga sp. JEA036 TaxID=2721162 RepID=UPI00143C30A1|nr:hypothetical protein [Croceivirga sp. JEA036]NJB36376.1 hypothetical protein [Croceivirga sp. JEA036]